jgi:hypothetical protein
VGRLAAAFTAALGTAALAGCGNDRPPAPDQLAVRAPGGTARTTFPQFGLTFRRPAAWSFDTGRPPLVATVVSGRAVVAIWRYRRREPLPRSRAELQGARKALVAAARRRDRRLKVISTRSVRVGGAPAIEVLAVQRIAGQRQRVRSTHVFARGAEVVVDAYSPPGSFRSVDALAFRPLVRSLRIGAARR